MLTVNADYTMARRAGKPRLILHAGTHKTGTTSVQSALRAHRAHLRAHGLVYPDGRVPYGDERVSHHMFAHSLTGVPPTAWMEATAFVAALHSDLRAGETAIVSSEPIYRHQYGQASQDFSIDPRTFWDRRWRYLEAVRKVLTPFDVEVVLYFRARDRFAESWYWHCMAERGPQPPFPAFIAAFAPWFDYEQHVATFRAVFDRVRIESYEEAFAAPGGLVPHFFRSMGCAPPPDLSERRARQGNYGGDAFGSSSARAAFLAGYPETIPR